MEIKIAIEDTKLFTYAAFILDQDNLLNKTEEIRPYWELRGELIPYDEFDTWFTQHKDDFSLTPEVANYWGELPDFSFTNTAPAPSLEIIQKIADSNHIELELEHLLRKNGLNASFRKLILKAVVCGEVRLSDWASTNDTDKFFHEDSFFNMKTYEKLYKGDTKPEIRRDREWYWENKRGKTPMQIAKETSYRSKYIPAEDFRQNVKNAIGRYELFLKSQGTFKRPK